MKLYERVLLSFFVSLVAGVATSIERFQFIAYLPAVKVRCLIVAVPTIAVVLMQVAVLMF